MTPANDQRNHALDAVRGFALLLGLVVHGSMSFLPGSFLGAWPILDHSRSTVLAVAFFSSHLFRMVLFFTIAGFFAHQMLERRGLRGFWTDRIKRIGVPLAGGWVLLYPLIAAVIVWSVLRSGGSLTPATPTPKPPAGAFPLGHLWFLYYLLIFYAAATGLRALAAGVDRAGRLMRLADRAMAWIAASRILVVVLGLPAAWVLYQLPDWMPGAGIPTPDSSIIPQVPAIAAFGTAFAVGWLLHRQQGLLEVLQRSWVIYGLTALGLTVLCLNGSGLWLASAAKPAQGLPKWEMALAYTTCGWCWSFGIMGIALRYLNQESRVRRYLADASYWIYLTHLPLIMAFAVLVAPLPGPALLKFPLIVAATLLVLLTSYHYGVRSTGLGVLLNGRRYPRRVPRVPAAAEPSPAAAGEAGLGAWVELKKASKRYGKLTAVNELDLTVRPGELLALLGPNGAGKSTAIALCLGLTQADAGEVQLLGRSPQDIEARRSVGVMMQEVFLAPELRVRELIDLAASYYPHPLPTDAVLELTGTREIAARLYGKLSGGQKRQAQFAIAVCGQPQLLFLDEPTVGLDVQAREALWGTLRVLIERGCSIVLTTHYLEEAEVLADRVVVLAHGQCIANGTVDEIRSVVSRRHIRCTTTVSEETARQWPEVTQVHRDARYLNLTAVDAEAVVQRLFASDPQLRGLEVHQAGLAEAFAELTKEAA